MVENPVAVWVHRRFSVMFRLEKNVTKGSVVRGTVFSTQLKRRLVPVILKPIIIWTSSGCRRGWVTQPLRASRGILHIVKCPHTFGFDRVRVQANRGRYANRVNDTSVKQLAQVVYFIYLIYFTLFIIAYII